MTSNEQKTLTICEMKMILISEWLKPDPVAR